MFFKVFGFMKRVPAVVFSLFFAVSCSLDYGVLNNPGETIPSMILTESSIKRVENGRLSFNVKSDYLEYYSWDNTWAGRYTEFTSYEDTGGVNVEGKTEEFFADLNKEEYIFISPVEVKSIKENMGIKAPKLKISRESNSISGSPNDIVLIESGDSVIEGRGFVMDSLTGEFSFLGDVSGEMGKPEEKDGPEIQESSSAGAVSKGDGL